jgi:endonuclease/exonuclease/phosphatase family metal-dependent hydrolase
MRFAPMARVLVVLTVLCACSGRGDSDGPVLPIIDLHSTTVGLGYDVQLTASGGVPPLRYSVNNVPPGFSFYADTARLTGPSTEAGEFTLTVGVTDAQGGKDSRAYVLKVYARPEISTASVPQATSGTAYAFALSAMGGQPPLKWTLADGSLPASMSLSQDGELTGVPRGLGGYPFTARVQDGNGAVATRLLVLEVRSGGSDGGVPDGGVAFPLQAGNWNVEWFGDTGTGRGPTNEQLQLDNVRTVISGAGADFWGLQEIVDVNHFNTLVQGLPGYAGLVANDPSVANGSTYYSSAEQKVAVLYKANVVQVLNAEVILGSTNSYDFAARPPLRVDLRVTRNGASVDLVAIVLHMKAETGQEDYDRRKRAGAALQQYLDSSLPTARVLVLGDWNDDVDMSIRSGQPTPYQNFLDAPQAYTFLTQTLSQSVGSQTQFTSFIDHQLVTNELAQCYVSNSATVLRPAIPDYGNTTSDHYPVLSRFDLGRPPTP